MELLLVRPTSLPCFSNNVKSQLQGRKYSTATSALPETAASVAVAAALVGAAVTLLVKRTKPTETKEHAKIVPVLVYAQNAMVKDLCSRNSLRKMLRGQENFPRIWLLASRPAFQRSGAIVQNVLLADHA